MNLPVIGYQTRRRDWVVANKKGIISGALLIAGIVMLCVGVMRGEADTVLSKAIRLCLECVGIG